MPFATQILARLANRRLRHVAGRIPRSRGELQSVSGLVLLLFAAASFRKLGRPEQGSRQEGFLRSLALVLMNPNILLIDLMLVAEATAVAGDARWHGPALYFCGMALAMPLIIGLIRRKQVAFARWRAPLEGLAAPFFVFIALKLLLTAGRQCFGRL